MQSGQVKLATLEALRNQLHNLEETIGRLLEMTKSLPEGETRNWLLEEISALGLIADVIRQAVDCFQV